MFVTRNTYDAACRERDEALALVTKLRLAMERESAALFGCVKERDAARAELATTYIRNDKGRIQRHPSFVPPIAVDGAAPSRAVPVEPDLYHAFAAGTVKAVVKSGLGITLSTLFIEPVVTEGNVILQVKGEAHATGSVASITLTAVGGMMRGITVGGPHSSAELKVENDGDRYVSAGAEIDYRVIIPRLAAPSRAILTSELNKDRSGKHGSEVA